MQRSLATGMPIVRCPKCNAEYGHAPSCSAGFTFKALTEAAEYFEKNDDPREADDWFQTFTGKRFFFNDPRPENVDIVDIAHALSNICRYGGMSRGFYSVAEHSCLIAWYARYIEKRSKAEVKHALCHDAAEAYTGDIKRPIKNAIPIIRQAVRRVEDIVAAALGIPAGKPQWLTDLDTRIVADEKTELMGRPVDGTLWGHETRGTEPLGVPIKCLVPALARSWFLETWQWSTSI